VKLVIVPENQSERNLLTALDENGINLKTHLLVGLKEGSRRNVRLSRLRGQWKSTEHQ
jgi:hypothetical protein